MPTEYIQTLIRNDVALVHCSSQSPMVGNTHTHSLGPLERIRNAIIEDIVISCSTLHKGDEITGKRDPNYTGNLGIIISPKKSDSITYAIKTDAGSTPESREKTRTAGLVCTIPMFEESIVLKWTPSLTQ